MLQRNLNKIESNVAELEGKLKHEQEKFKTYNTDLKEAEKRCALCTAVCPADVHHLVLSTLVKCESVNVASGINSVRIACC